MSQFPKTLAIDYGTQRVGVAVSYGSLAEPLTIFSNDHSLFSAITELLDEHTIEQIVVGLSENTMAEQTRAFVAELQKHTDIPIELMDETLSSATVHQKLAERSGKKQTPKGHIDHLAAAEILQEWLETHSFS